VARRSDRQDARHRRIEVGVLPVSGMVVFPNLVVPVAVGQDPSAKLVDDALSGDKRLAVVTRKAPSTEGDEETELYSVGTLCQILKMLRMPDGGIRLLIQGLSRVLTGDLTQTSPYLRAEVSVVEEEEEPQTTEIEALKRSVAELFGRIVAASGQLPDELSVAALNMAEVGWPISSPRM
jgi:ATP-dependent Lon protease